MGVENQVSTGGRRSSSRARAGAQGLAARRDGRSDRRRSTRRRCSSRIKAGRRRKAGAPMRGQPTSPALPADSIRAMMLIRTYRVRGHLAANLDPLGLSQRDLPADLTPEYHGFSGADPRSQDLYRRHAGLGVGPRSARSWTSCAATTAAMSASNICTSPTWRSAASCRTAWKARTRRSASRPSGKKAILTKVIHAEQYGEVPGPQICRHQALRPRRRRSHDPGARSGHQIWRPDRRARDRLSAWPIAAASTCSPM